MAQERYCVQLTEEERGRLNRLIPWRETLGAHRHPRSDFAQGG